MVLVLFCGVLQGPDRLFRISPKMARPSLVVQAAAPLAGAGLIALVGAEGTLDVLAVVAGANLVLAAVLFRQTAHLRVA